MALNERFGNFIKYKQISIKDVACTLGKTDAYVRKLLRPGESFGIEPVLAILNGFKDLSAEWLLRGEGNMLRNESTPIVENKESISIDRLLSIIESQQRTIENLSRK